AKAESDRRAAEEAEKARIAQQKADEEIRKARTESDAKLAASEAARQQAEERARTEAAAHFAAARGKISIITEPAGATVTVDNLPPRTSPALIDNLKLGHYPVTISLKNYDDVKL